MSHLRELDLEPRDGRALAVDDADLDVALAHGLDAAVRRLVPGNQLLHDRVVEVEADPRRGTLEVRLQPRQRAVDFEGEHARQLDPLVVAPR